MPTDTIKISRRQLEAIVKKIVSGNGDCGLTPDMVIHHTKVIDQLEIILPEFKATLESINQRVDVNEDDILVIKTEKKTLFALIAGIIGCIFGGSGLIAVLVYIIEH